GIRAIPLRHGCLCRNPGGDDRLLAWPKIVFNKNREGRIMKLKRHFQIAAITFFLAFGNFTQVFCQATQNNPASSPQIQKVKDKVQKLGITEDVTVILLTGKEYYGAISKIEPDSFEIAEVDLKQRITFDYTDVKKVRKGYGGWNYI